MSEPSPGRLAACLLAAAVSAAAVSPAAADARAEAQEILRISSIRGGLFVHVGCGNGALAAALAAGEGRLVHALDADPAHVAAARGRLREAGLYGKVSVDRLSGRRLPYIDNLVNLLVVEDAGAVDQAELTRVLAPGGVACVRTAKGWRKLVKPRPQGIDEWTHFLHGPDNNAVARDTVVGPPRRLQWVAGPRYGRHHDKMSSVSAVVSAGGRVFYIIDEAPPFSILTAPQWHLVARDAFNGTALWRRAVGKWFHHMFGLKSGPADLPRKLVASADHVYVTLGLGEPVTALDAATGRTVRTYPQTANAEEILHCGGVLFVKVAPGPVRTSAAPAIAQAPPDDEAGRTVLALDAPTGRTLWSVRTPVARGTLATDGRRVALLAGERIVCLDARTGRPLWRSDPLPRPKHYPLRFTPTLVLYGDVVLFAGGEKAFTANRSWAVRKDDTLSALSAETGRVLWQAPHPLSSYASGEDVLVLDGVVWFGETTSGHAVGTFTGRDVHTGRIVRRFDPDVQTYWFHHRCYRGKATEKYLLMSRAGTEFIDPAAGTWQIHDWVRGACLYGVMPANGLLYAPQHPCACFIEAKLAGFNAVAPAGASAGPAPASPRLEKGPARAEKPDAPAAAGGPQAAEDPRQAEDWPTYRHDAARSGRASTAVPVAPKRCWAAKVGGRLTAPVVAGGKVYVASIDTHTVHALRAADGTEAWRFTAGGRVDSPPTVWRGWVLFGSADGFVYCLRAADGALAWRFRAAPADRRLVAWGQVESVWPVHGSVLVREGVAYFVAGRSAFLDGGMRLVRLEAASGRVLSETLLDDRDPAGEGSIQNYVRQLNMPVCLPDVLSCDGRLVYMRSQPFALDGTRLPPEALPYAGNPERYSVPADQRPDRAHLFSPTGFLDDSWWHRTYWIYGSRFLGGWAGYPRAGKVTPGGRILVFDESSVYGFGRKMKFYRWTTPIEHHLFRAEKPTRGARPADQRGAGGKRKAPSPAVRHIWTKDIPLLPRAMLLAEGTGPNAGRVLWLAGPPDLVDEEADFRRLSDPAVARRVREQAAAMRGARGGALWAVSTRTAETLSRLTLDTIPVFDGLAAARGRLYLACLDGRVLAFEGE